MIHVDIPSTGVKSLLANQAPLTKERETALFYKALNSSAISLYSDMAKVRNLANKNFVFFTPNLFASLSMLYAGAPPPLQVMMEKAFHMGEITKDRWHSQFKLWSNGIQQRSQLLVGEQQSFFFQQVQMTALHASVRFTEQAKQNLAAYNCEQLQFTDPQDAGIFINKRIEGITEGQIKDLVSQGDLTSDLMLLMASAALFKGQWQYPFDKLENSHEMFSNWDGTKVKVEMMNQALDDMKMAYDSLEGSHSIKMLELPFHGDISVLIMQPTFGYQNTVSSCADQLKHYMTQENVQNLLDRFDARFQKRSALTVGIPKLNLHEKVDLLEELGHTGLAQAIKNSDFNGSLIDANSQVSTPKLVSEVHFTMDEAGAQVAAASYSPSYQESCDPTFKLNGPFAMVIVDKSTKTILGMAQVLKMEVNS